MAFLESAAKHREMYLMNRYRMARESIAKGETEAPYAYIVPMTQRDPNTAAKMLNIFIANGAEVHRATDSFEAENRSYPAGTYVVLMSQPYRPFLKDMLGPQVYPDRRQYEDGPPELPFDLTGWTLAYQMGVEAVEVTFAFDADLERVTEAKPPSAAPPRSGDFYILDHAVNDSFRAVNSLLKQGFDVSWAREGFSVGGRSYPAGAILASGNGISRHILSLSEELSLQIDSATGSLPRDRLALEPLKLGLYQPWTADMDEGWTRWILDTWEFPYTTIHDAEVRSGNLEAAYDVILLTSISPESIIEGNEEGSVPSQYAGGIGHRGVTNLIRFVNEGGTLITFDASSNLAIEQFKLPVVNVVKGVEPEEFFCPGTLLNVEVDNTHPVAFGMDSVATVMFAGSPVFEILESADGSRPTAVVSYPNVNPLASGWILGEEKLFGKHAVVVTDYGKGKLVLFGFGPQNRAQTHGTFKLFFNALYYR